MAVCRNVKRFLRVEKAHDVAWERGVDNGSSDELVHGFVVRGMSGIMDEAGTTGIDAAGEEGHAQRLIVRNPLESANDVRALQILQMSLG